MREELPPVFLCNESYQSISKISISDSKLVLLVYKSRVIFVLYSTLCFLSTNKTTELS